MPPRNALRRSMGWGVLTIEKAVEVESSGRARQRFEGALSRRSAEDQPGRTGETKSLLHTGEALVIDDEVTTSVNPGPGRERLLHVPVLSDDQDAIGTNVKPYVAAIGGVETPVITLGALDDRAVRQFKCDSFIAHRTSLP